MAKYTPKHLDNSAAPKRGRIVPVLILILVLIIVLVAAGIILKPYIEDALYVELYPELTVEAGSPLPEAQAFLAEEEDVVLSYSSDISTIKTDQPGAYPVSLVCKEEIREAVIHIVDTVPPRGQTQDLTVLQKDMPAAADFVTDIQDVTAVSIQYEAAPDENNADPQQVTILLTDAGGNVTRLSATLTVIIDTQAPAIEGVTDRTVYQGTTIAYRSGVTVTDDQDDAPTLTIDSSAVDLSTPGVYQAVYTAADMSGNSASATATITVMEKKDDYVDLETVHAEVNTLLDQIIEDDMTTMEQIETVFWWIRRNCTYVNTPNDRDWVQSGYQMLKTGKGDCYYYAGLCHLMLEQLGIPVIPVHKVPLYEGGSNHAWNLVSADGGETYYHVDVTPRSGDSTVLLMVTDSFLDDYSARHNHSHNRDKSLYPATPEE